jgi:hypothetical protein
MSELTPDERDVLARIKDKEELRPLFFRKARGLRWFNALDRDGYFSPDLNPRPVPAKEEGYVNVPFWPAIEYIVTVSEELREVQNQKYAVRVLDIVRSVTKHARDSGFGNYRTWWQFSKIIRHIPPHLITEGDVFLFDYWMDDRYERGLVAENLGEHWLVELLDRNDEHCKTLAIGLLNRLYGITFKDRRYGTSDRKEAVLRFDSWHAKKITKKAAAKAGQALRHQAVGVFRTALERVLTILENDGWSSVWRAAVEDHKQNYSADDAEDILVEGMRDAILAFISESPDDGKRYVGELLGSHFETIQRIAIHAIDQQYQRLADLAGQVLEVRFFTSNFRHEMWHLLNNHYPQFSERHQESVLKIIECLTERDDASQENKGAVAYRRAIWLSAIHRHGDDESRLYQECIKVAGGEPEHPDFSSYMTSGWVVHESPMPKDELLSMEIDELVGRLVSYKDPGKFREPGIEGLTKALREIVKSSPTRFFTQLPKFEDLDLGYIYELLEAYGELWVEKAQLPWDEIWKYLLAFCNALIKQEQFWSAEKAKERSSFVANRHWVVGSIARLIENGVKSDEHAFSENYLEDAQEILLLLLKNEKGGEFKLDSDAVSISINSPRGRSLEAFINLSLRLCRLADKKTGSHVKAWSKLESSYDAELKRADISEYEFATLVVNYLPNFLYMSRGWVLNNLPSIFDQGNYQKWLCAMNGYAYVNTVYQEIYSHLSKYGHFFRALDDEHLKERVSEKIVQNVVLAYIDGFEELSDEHGLIYWLLKRKDINELSQLIWFMWTFRDGKNVKIQKKVFEIWSRLMSLIDLGSRDGKKLASKLCTWSVFIDEINDVSKPLVLAVVEYVEHDYNSHDLLEMIARTSKAQPREAYEIWCKMLEGTKSDFPEEAVRTALVNIALSGAEGLRHAKDIVSAYLKGGNERPSVWLTEIVDTAHG